MAFLIDGKEYEVPTLDSITIGESRVVKRYTGAAGQALQELDPNDPDMTAAMIHIAFKRENPGMSFAALERMVDEVKWVSLDFTEEETEDDAAPFDDRARRLAERRNGIFWRRFERELGALPGDREPAGFWRPALGHYFGIRPADIGDLTPGQLMACIDSIEKG